MEFTTKEMDRLGAIASVLTEHQGQLNVGQVLALIAVAERPGLSVNELSDNLGQPQQTVSRNVAILSGRYQMVPGITPRVFISQGINADDPRSRALFLEKDGRAFLKALASDAKAAGRKRS